MRMITNHVISYTAHCPNSLPEHVWYLQEECQMDQAERESVPLHNLPNITTEITVNLVPRLDWCSGQFAIAQTLVDRPDPPS